MKTTLLALVLALAGLESWAQTPPGLPATNQFRRPPRFGTNGPVTPPRYAPGATTPPRYAPGATLPAATHPSAAANPAQPEEMIPPGTINFQGVDVDQVLEIYAQLVGRTLLRAGLPKAQIVLKTQTPLTKTEAIEALQAVLALNGIAVVNVGDKFVKVGPVDQANTFGAEFNDTSVTNLPDLGSYVTRIVQLKYVKPTEMVPIIQPFAKLANSILPIDSNGILVLRDNAENVKRMMEMIDKVDVSVPAEFISEVIPIKYAEAGDIANALNSLGGGGSTVSFGSSSGNTPINGIRGGSGGASGFGGAGGFGGASGYGGSSGFGGASGYGARPFGTTTALGGANGTPTAGSTFQSRLQNIINRASGNSTGGGGGKNDDQIQVFGQAKIIADERSNSLLVFASRQDIEKIRQVIDQLDVLLAQVLIESIIMDVGIGHTLSAGVSAVQKPKQFNNSNVTGGGAVYNGNSFLSTIQSLATNGSVISSSSLTNLGSGLSYFGSIGDTWDIAVSAAESDNNANIIQRPRIQTSQAKPAQFFVGQTVPYVNNTYNNAYSGGYGGSSYSQLSVGVELDVTPFINPDGLVVMDIQQEIDEISGYTAIDGNNVPNTIKRTLSSEIAVKNRDTVILGGFVRSDKSHARSGVPILMDIPLLGWLFSKTDNSKDRTELMVMMRPTVLKTPEIAAAQTIKEAQRLPGVSAAAAENAEDERALVDAERKRELKRAQSGKPADGFFNMKINAEDGETNLPANDFGSAPHVRNRPPATGSGGASVESTNNQDKARTALDQKLNDLDESPAPAQPQ
jgi:general secretion pathway protein D